MTTKQDMPETIWAFSTGETDHPEFWAGGCTNSKSYMESKSVQYTRTETVQAKLAAADGLVGALRQYHEKIYPVSVQEALAAYEGVG